MLTKSELITQLVNAQVADAIKRDLETKKGYGDRIRKAGDIVLSGGVKALGNGEYEVTSPGKDAKPYIVNGKCDCQDALNYHKQAKGEKVRSFAPAGFCKHRMAPVILNKVEAHLLELRDLKVPHPHRWSCTAHRDIPITCWQRVCPDPADVACPICAKAPSLTAQVDDEEARIEAQTYHPDDEHEPGEDANYTEDPEPEETPRMMTTIGETLKKVITFSPLTGETPEPEPCGETHPGMTCQEYERGPLSTEQYEPAPVLTPRAEPLPEAPVSLCITIKMADGNGLSYTMRGADDVSVLERLPVVLATMERLLKVEVDHEAGFVTRIVHAFFPRKRATTGK